MRITRRSFMRTLVAGAVAVRALPLLEKLASVLPAPVSQELWQARKAYFDKAFIATLKANVPFTAAATPRSLPSQDGKTIRFVRYEGK